MIRLTRINGSEFSLNPDLIHRAEETPDTVLTLIDGSRYVVVQKLDELIERIVEYRARVVAAAGRLAETPVEDEPGTPGAAHGQTGFDEESEGADVVRLRTRRA